MRGFIGRSFSNPNNGFSLTSIVKQTPFLIRPTSHFSSSSDGAGRGRGRGSGFDGGRGQFGFNRDSEKANEPLGNGRGSSESQSPGGYGHGRGRPIQSDPVSPPFSSFVRPGPPSVGRGRGSAGSDPVSPFAADPPRHPPHQPRFQPQQQPSPPPPPQQQRSEPAKDEFQGSSRPQLSRENQQPSPPPPPPRTQTTVFAKLQEATSSPPPPLESKPGQPAQPNNIFNAIGSEFSHPNQRLVPGSGAGRGKPSADEGDRHIRRPQPPLQQQRSYPQRQQAQTPKSETPRPQLSREEAGRRARSALSRGDAEGGGVRGRGGGRGRGRGARGRGRGNGGVEWRDEKIEEEAEKEAIRIFVGESADGEKFAENVGPEMMDSLVKGFEDVCERALPSAEHDALVDAYETNLMVKFLCLCATDDCLERFKT